MKTESNFDNFRNIAHVDTLVHLGAGRCAELDEYLALQPRQLLLVEADSQLAEKLRHRIDGVKQAQVSCVAIAGNPGQSTYYRYNLPELNSLHPASGLTDLFPGLKVAEQLLVTTVSPTTLVAPLQLQVEKENRLIINLPGEELPVLQALQQSEHLELFSQIYLYCGRKPLYEGSEPATRILDWLRDRGFDLVAEDNSHDPDRPCWSLRRNALKLCNRDLQQQIEQLIEKNAGLVLHVVDLQAQIQNLTKDCDGLTKLAAKQQTQLEQQTKSQNEQAKLVAELKDQLEQMKKANDEVEKMAAEQLKEEQQKLQQQLLQHQTELEQQSKIEAGLKRELIDAR